jgi:hypothetical protein
VYGQKQARRVWNQYLVNHLVNRASFKQSKMDDCIFYKGNVIYVLYTDDSILVIECNSFPYELVEAKNSLKVINKLFCKLFLYLRFPEL